MKLYTFEEVKKTEDNILDGVSLSNQYCGLFRCPLPEAHVIMPDMEPLFQDAIAMLKGQGHNFYEWELDLKIHMLMKDQFPCLPNFHCDNVPRESGKTQYSKIDTDNTPPMYLWVSDEPTTEFLATNWNTKDFTPKGHSDLADYVRGQLSNGLTLQKIPSKTWISMNQLTPHRGTVAKESGWRVFARLTHNSLTPQRPVDSSYIRRHCQVYLDASEFSW